MNSKTIPKQKIEELNLDDEQNYSSRPRIDPNIILNEFPLSPQAHPESVASFGQSTRRNYNIEDNHLDTYIQEIKSTIIEKYEVDLYNTIEKFYDTSCKSLRTKDLLLTHLIYNFEQNSDSRLEDDLQSSLTLTVSNDPVAPIKYHIIRDLSQILSALLVKWNIFKIERYEYRYSRRVEYLKIIEIEKFTRACINIETLWFCVAISKKCIKEIATRQLMQYAEILENHLDKVLSKLMEERFVCIPSIEDAIALKSKKYRQLYAKHDPVPFLGENNYLELKMPTFIIKKLWKNRYQRIIEIENLLVELEIAYRTFEKELIGRFFLIS